MLVLTRKKRERVIIGDSIEVAVLDVSGNRVRLGFTCPDDVRILREEVARRIDASHGETESPAPPAPHISKERDADSDRKIPRCVAR